MVMPARAVAGEIHRTFASIDDSTYAPADDGTVVSSISAHVHDSTQGTCGRQGLHAEHLWEDYCLPPPCFGDSSCGVLGSTSRHVHPRASSARSDPTRRDTLAGRAEHRSICCASCSDGNGRDVRVAATARRVGNGRSRLWKRRARTDSRHAADIPHAVDIP